MSESEYVISDLEGEFGISHISAENRHDAAEKYVRIEILGNAGRDILDLEEIEIGVVLESEVKIFGITPSFEMLP